MYNGISDFLECRKIKYQRNVDLSGYSTIGICAEADYMVSPEGLTEFIDAVGFLRENGIAYRVVGRMSNVIPASPRFNGVILRTTNINRKSLADGVATMECGVGLTGALRHFASLGFGGCEQLYYIPCTVGGAVCGNAGAHGMEIADAFISGIFLDPKTMSFTCLSKDEMRFGYRTSRAKDDRLILLSADIRLREVGEQEFKDRLAHYKALRLSQPISEKTAGSIFKRVDGISAGYYIDKCGLKGYRVGGAEVSEKHAGFIVNKGYATPADVVTLIKIIKNRVLEKFGIMLEEEIIFI